MSAQIRSAETTDLDEICEFDEFGGDRISEIASGNCFVAVVDFKVVAYVSYLPKGLLGQPLLSFLCVRKEFRRQGIATLLVKFIQTVAQGRVLISSTEDWCSGTQSIFENLGWRKLGELSGINKDGSSEWFYGVNISSDHSR